MLWTAATELRRRGAQDHCGHPRAAGDREDPHPPRAGSSTAAQGPGARGGARLRRLSRAGRRGHITAACTVKPQPGRRCTPCQRGAVEVRVDPESEAARPKAPFVNGPEPAELAQRTGAGSRSRQFRRRRPAQEPVPGATGPRRCRLKFLCSGPGFAELRYQVPKA